MLDSGPLGLVTNPKESAEAIACRNWLWGMVAAGHRALVPAITDYEVRRELRLFRKVNGIANLDRLKATLGFLPLTNDALLEAAEYWATVRQAGLPTADRFALDADVILAAQTTTLDPRAWLTAGAEVMIATTNVGHLTRFAAASIWADIAV